MSWEVENVRDPGGVFRADNVGVYQKVADGLSAIGETVRIFRFDSDRNGVPLPPTHLRLQIHGANLMHFWIVANTALAYREDLQIRLQTPEEIESTLDTHISEAIVSLGGTPTTPAGE